jgi:hypothetical protein
MTGSKPGEPAEPGERGRMPARATRRLPEAPSARYRGPSASGSGSETAGRSALTGPLLRAVVIALIGAAVLWLVGAVFASTAGLLFASGATGATIGLVLARAAVPLRAATPVSRRTVTWLSVAMALAAVVAAAVLTWLFAKEEGGTLGFADYLLTTFGPFVPGEAVVAAITAWWGATSGPVQR